MRRDLLREASAVLTHFSLMMRRLFWVHLVLLEVGKDLSVTSHHPRLSLKHLLLVHRKLFDMMICFLLLIQIWHDLALVHWLFKEWPFFLGHLLYDGLKPGIGVRMIILHYQRLLMRHHIRLIDWNFVRDDVFNALFGDNLLVMLLFKFNFKRLHQVTLEQIDNRLDSGFLLFHINFERCTLQVFSVKMLNWISRLVCCFPAWMINC